jgi:hypothetical protein
MLNRAATGPYPEADESSPNSHITLLQYYPPIYVYVSQLSSSLEIEIVYCHIKVCVTIDGVWIGE